MRVVSMDAPTPTYLTSTQVAERLQVTRRWVENAARSGKLPSVHMGRYVRFDWADVEAAVREGS